MRLRFVGGTSFVGRHTVESAVAAGHDVTVFHRGRINDGLLAGSDGITSATTGPP
jgi:2'-hydroxyisoflavone reductase